MTFSFDLDGVCLERPRVFAAIAHALKNAGHRVGVLTGHIALHFDDYDYDFPDTIKLFRELGQEPRIARLRSTVVKPWSVP